MALQTVIAGSRGLSLISGEAGIGKTRLAKEFEERAAARGCKVLAGSCLPSAQIPYWVFLEALNDLFDEDARRKVDRASRLKEAAKRAAPDLMKAIPTVGLTAKASAVLFKEYRGEIEGAEAHKQHVLLLEVEWMLDESKDRRQLAAAYDLHRSLYLSMGEGAGIDP
jgi:predicted ATPase